MQDSFYHYKPGALRELVKRISDKSAKISDVFGNFREMRVCPIEFRNKRVQELSDNPRMLQELVSTVVKRMQPESQYSLPYKKAEREKELIDSIAEEFAIDRKYAKAKVVTDHYKDSSSTQEFNYAVEVVVAPRTDLPLETNAGTYEFIGNINSTPSIDGGEKYFDDGPFEFVNKKNETRRRPNIAGILYECGFNQGDFYNKTKKKVPCVIMVNIKTPCPDWLGSAGKTKIDLAPYARHIAQTIYLLTKDIPVYHPKKKSVETKKKREQATKYLIDFLEQREKDIEADSTLLVRDRLTQSGVWYRIRPKMIKDKFEPNKDWGTTRKSVTDSIRDICEEYFDKSREQLGIVAAARATMLYHGLSIPVSIDNCKGLAHNGVAIIVIEKEGIADVIADQARKYGIALVHTQGRLTEYGKDLIEAVKSVGGIVAILVDYDLVGQRIVRSTRTDTPTIGISKDTVEWLRQNGYPNLTVQQVEEEYSVELTAEDELYEDQIDKYLLNKRIELDSIVAQVGADGLWKYIMYKLKMLGPFNYTAEVSMPPYESLYSPEMGDLLTYFNEYTTSMVNEEENKVLDNELLEVDELLEVEEKEEELQTRFEEIANKDEGYKTISKEVKELLKRLPKPKHIAENEDKGEG